VPPAADVYPSAWFDNPGLDHAVALRVERDTRRIYGYVAEWGSCHIGVDGFCQEVPPNFSGYAYFLKGVIDTDAGERFVGTLTYAGHASRFARLSAAAGADLVIAIYNPASQSRKEQLVRAREVLLRHRSPATPVVVGRDVGGPEESVRVTTLGDLDPATIDMRCLLIVGSSQTRVTTRGDGSTQVYTPRHYPT
jgi:hypothetical protein